MSREVSLVVSPTFDLNHCRFSSTSVIRAMGASQIRAASSVRSSKTSSGIVSSTSYCQSTFSRCFSFGRIGGFMGGEHKGPPRESKKKIQEPNDFVPRPNLEKSAGLSRLTLQFPCGSKDQKE